MTKTAKKRTPAEERGELEREIVTLYGQEGKSWSEVASILANEGYKDRTGKPYTTVNLRRLWSKGLKNVDIDVDDSIVAKDATTEALLGEFSTVAIVANTELSDLEAPTQDSQVAKDARPETSIEEKERPSINGKVAIMKEPRYPSINGKDATTALPDNWKAEIQGMIDSAVSKALEHYSQVATVATDLEEPPLPHREEGSKKYSEDSQRARLAGTVPIGLLQMFEEDMKRRGKNFSQMLQFILFNYYRKYPLKGDEDA